MSVVVPPLRYAVPVNVELFPVIVRLPGPALKKLKLPARREFRVRVFWFCQRYNSEPVVVSWPPLIALSFALDATMPPLAMVRTSAAPARVIVLPPVNFRLLMVRVVTPLTLPPTLMLSVAVPAVRALAE